MVSKSISAGTLRFYERDKSSGQILDFSAFLPVDLLSSARYDRTLSPGGVVETPP